MYKRQGFLGAGLILHNRNRLSGLASAASVWVVASIGMACGAGLYAPATVAAFIVIAAMVLVGFLETRVNLKPYFVTYEVRGACLLYTSPSALAWLAACFGLYRLARIWLPPAPSLIALAFFALNPNLLYLQTTAMTEQMCIRDSSPGPLRALAQRRRKYRRIQPQTLPRRRLS